MKSIKSTISILLITLMTLSFVPQIGLSSLNKANFVALENNTQNYVTGAWDVDYSKLNLLTGYLGVSMNVAGFKKVIETYFIPLNMKFVGLWMQWEEHANTTSQNVQFNQWVEDWLNASASYGIQNIFWIRQYGTRYRYWDDDVFDAYPEARVTDSKGDYFNVSEDSTTAVSFAHPSVYYQYREDLKQLYQYYGAFDSWVGFGGYSGDYSYYGSKSAGSIKNGTFNEYHFEDFTRSVYYLRNVNITGYHLTDGTKDKFWEMYVDNGPLLSLVSGYPDSTGWNAPIDIYSGNGTGGRVLAFKFMSPTNSLYGFKVSFYGKRQGSAGDLQVNLYDDLNDAPKNVNSPKEKKTVLASAISTSDAWQVNINFSSVLVMDTFYWVVFYANGGDTNNGYDIYRSEYRINESECKTSTNGLASFSTNKGAFLLVRNSTGTVIKAYPKTSFANKAIIAGQTAQQLFTAPKNMTINAVFASITDRAHSNDPRPLPVKLIRVSDGIQLANGSLSYLNFGSAYWYVPAPLNESVTLVKNTEYRLDFGPAAANAIFWQILEQTTNPQIYGFQNKSSYLLFALGNMNFSSVKVNDQFQSIALQTQDPINSTWWQAQGFTPSQSGTLANVSIYMQKRQTPSALKLMLYSDDPTAGSGWGLSKPNSVLETVYVPQASVANNTFTNVTGFSYSLTGGTKYWLVIAENESSSGKYYLYTANPPIKYPFVTTHNSGSSWSYGLPQTNTYAEAIIKIVTSAETMYPSPWKATDYRLRNNELVAQSFSPTANVTIRGLTAVISQGNWYYPVIAELRADNASYNKPSKTVLAKTSSYGFFDERNGNMYDVKNWTLGTYPGTGLFAYKSGTILDFRFPVNVTAGVKYWLVLKSVSGGTSTVAVSKHFEPARSYGNTTFKALRSVDTEATWSLPDGEEGDLQFSLITTIHQKKYSMPTLYNELVSYHSQSLTYTLLKGWNGYINTLPPILISKMTDWLIGYTNKSSQWINMYGKYSKAYRDLSDNPYVSELDFGTVGPLGQVPMDGNFSDDLKKKVANLMRDEDILPWSSIGQPQDNMGYITREQIQLYYTKTVPILGRIIVSVMDWSSEKLSNLTHQDYSRAFGEILNRMQYVGDYAGFERQKVKALLIGDQDTGLTPQFFSMAIDTDFCGYEGITGDYNLTQYNDFSDYDSVVWIADRPKPTEITVSAQDRIKSFVQSGGGFVYVGGTWATWMKDILGINVTTTSISYGSISYVNYSNPILKPYSSISEYLYYWRNKRIDITTAKIVVNDTNSNPWITTNTYGSGRGVFLGSYANRLDNVGMETGKYYGAPRSSWMTLATNAILYSAFKENLIPAWYYTSAYKATHSWTTGLRYSLLGEQGKPLLLWLSNDNTTSTTFTLHLNATYYGISNNWEIYNVQTWKLVNSGSTNDILINVTVPAKNWYPLYIVNATSNLYDIYTNGKLVSRNVQSSYSNFTVSGYYNQSVFVAIKSSGAPSKVTLNNTVVLAEKSLSVLNATNTENGWNYNSTSDVLLVKFKTASTYIVSVEAASEGNNIWMFNFSFADLDSANVESYVTWKLYNVSQLLTYAEGEHSITDGTYTLKTYYMNRVVNSTSLPTASLGNTTVEIKLNMKPHSSVSNGYIASNNTVSALTVNSQTATNLTFTISGSVPAQLIVAVPKNASYIQKNSVNQTGWVYDSTTIPYHMRLNVTGLSSWELIFPSSANADGSGSKLDTVITVSAEYLNATVSNQNVVFIEGYLKTAYGYGIVGKQVRLESSWGFANYSVTSDNGYFRIGFETPKQNGKYDFTLKFVGDNIYNSYTLSLSLTVVEKPFSPPQQPSLSQPLNIPLIYIGVIILAIVIVVVIKNWIEELTKR